MSGVAINCLQITTSVL